MVLTVAGEGLNGTDSDGGNNGSKDSLEGHGGWGCGEREE